MSSIACEPLLHGEQDGHLVPFAQPRGVVLLHPDVVRPFESLLERSRQRGFEITIASSFRSFERQLLIWNNKATGLRDILNDDDQVIDISGMSDDEKMWAILRFSALPGFSRHHWGSDLDVFDAKSMQPGYQLQLTVGECEANGVFCRFHQWLTEELGNTDFYRPYSADHGALAREPWHLSYRPVSKSYVEALDYERCYRYLCGLAGRLELFSSVKNNFSDIYSRYIAC